MVSDEEYQDALRAYSDYEVSLQRSDVDAAERCLVKLTEMKSKYAVEQGEARVWFAETSASLQHGESFEEAADRVCSASSRVGRFRLTPDQRRVKLHMMRPQSRSMLLVHGTGQGKTCTGITIAEHFLTTVFPTLAGLHGNDDNDRRPLVLLPAHLKSIFVKQLFDVNRMDFDENGRLASDDVHLCVGNKYLRYVPQRHSIDSPEALQLKVQRLINKKFYRVMSHMEFANFIEKIEQDVNRMTAIEGRRAVMLTMRLKRMFSNRVILIDEVHNLRVSNDEFSKKVPPRLWQVLRSSDNVRLVMMSATPMFNDAKEIVFLANLMLLNEKRRPLLDIEDVFSQEELDPNGESRLRDAMVDRVSYVVGGNPFSFPFRLTPKFHSDPRLLRNPPTKSLYGEVLTARDVQNIKSLSLVVSRMRGKSLATYASVKKSIKRNRREQDQEEIYEEENEEEGSSSGSDFHLGLQVSNIVFPDMEDTMSNYGSKNLARCFDIRNRNSRSVSMRYREGIPEFLSPERLSDYAPKIHTVLESIKKSVGKILVFSAYKSTGVIPIALALEHIGIVRYGNSRLLDMQTQEAKSVGSYIIWTGDSTICCDESHLDVFNSHENRHGDLIKVLLCTRRGSEGLDMKCVREVHVMDPWYHMNRVEQVMGRAARHCSHASLPIEMRNVTTYLHVACEPEDSVEESIDVRVYRIACRKQRLIAKVETLLKDVSIERDMATSSTTDIKIKQKSSQGYVGYVTVKAPVPPRAKRVQRQFEAVSDLVNVMESLLKPGEFVKVAEAADRLGTSVESAALTLETMMRSGSLRRVGNLYYSPFSNQVHRVVGGPVNLVKPASDDDQEIEQRARTKLDKLLQSAADIVSRVKSAMRDEYVSATMDDLAVDCCVDSMASPTDLTDLVSAARSNGAHVVLQSLRDSHIVFGDDDEFLYDPFTDAYQKGLTAFAYVAPSPLDAESLQRHRSIVTDRVKTMTSNIGDQDHGVVAKTAKQGFVFKLLLRELSSNPVVCSLTPTVTPEMIKRALGIDISNSSIKKRDVCFAVELILRHRQKVYRPAWWIAQQKMSQ